MVSRLSPGRTSASTWSMPQARGDGVSRGCRVAGDEGGLQAHAMEGLDRIPCLILDWIGDREQGGDPGVDGGEDRRFAFVGKLIKLGLEGGGVDVVHLHQARGADQNVLVVHGRGETVTGLGLDRLDRGQSEAFGLGGGLDGAGDGVLGLCLCRGDGGEGFGAVEAGGEVQRGEAWAAHRERAGLVEGDDLCLGQGLERVALAEEHAEFGGATGADHDRGGRGEAHGAGAGDNQDRDACHEGETEGGIGTEGEPCKDGQDSGGDDHGHEDAHHAVGQRLDREFGALGLLDHGDDAGEHGVAADAGGGHGQRVRRR